MSRALSVSSLHVDDGSVTASKPHGPAVGSGASAVLVKRNSDLEIVAGDVIRNPLIEGFSV